MHGTNNVIIKINKLKNKMLTKPVLVQHLRNHFDGPYRVPGKASFGNDEKYSKKKSPDENLWY